MGTGVTAGRGSSGPELSAIPADSRRDYWPDAREQHKILRAPTSEQRTIDPTRMSRSFLELYVVTVISATLAGQLAGTGCAQRNDVREEEPPPTTVEVVVVTPVMNLSGSLDWDPVKVTDWLASELTGFPGVAVVPVNRTLAALDGSTVETAAEAREVARKLGADGAIVAAVTEFSGFDPPRSGWVMQWYAAGDAPPAATSDPANTYAADASAVPARVVQVQRNFSAADDDVQEEIREYADDRDESESPFGWRQFIKSQELFVRYSCWSTIRSILRQRNGYRTAAHEAPAESVP